MEEKVDSAFNTLLNNSSVEKAMKPDVGETDASFDLLLAKGLDTSKLVKKKVQIRGKNGQVFYGYRWVDPNTGESVKPTKTSKNYDSYHGDFESKVSQIAEKTTTKGDKIRDLIATGIYDPGFMMQLSPELDPVNIRWYLKEAGVPIEHVRKKVVDKINELLGHSHDPEQDDEGKKVTVENLEDKLSNKDLEKVLKRSREERKKKYNITVNDRWNTYDMYLQMMIRDRMGRSMIAYGSGGIGKTYGLLKALEKNGKRAFDFHNPQSSEDYDYVKIGANTSPTDLYNIMYQHSDKLLVFDDCDSMWAKGKDSFQNMLKTALDSSGDRMIHYGNPKRNQATGERPPQDFQFNGQIIFISNLKRESFPPPLVDSRSLAIDLTMNMDETIEKLKTIKDNIEYKTVDGEPIEVSPKSRQEIIDFLEEFKDEMKVQQINGRVLGNLGLIKTNMEKEGKSYEDFVKTALVSLNLA